MAIDTDCIGSCNSNLTTDIPLYDKSKVENLIIFQLSGADANVCPQGYYCTVGTADPIPCPKGTFSNGTGLEAEVDCVLCPAGSYCAETGMTNTSGLCMEG